MLVRGYYTTFVGRAMFLQEWAMAMNINVVYISVECGRSGPMVKFT